MPRFSVLLPTHHRPDTLGLSIRSVLAQSFADFELLIIGDGVAEATRALIAGFDDRRLQFIDLEKAPHFGYANRNVGLRRARGELVAVAADDDLWLPDHLEIMGRLFDDARIAWAHSRPLWASPDGLVLPMLVNLKDPAELDSFLSVRNVLPAVTVVYRRSCHDRYGYWPEDVPIAGDWHLWKRIVSGAGGDAIGASRVPTTLHFRNKRQQGETWGPPPLAELEQTARTVDWWPRGLRFPISGGEPEQASVSRSIERDPVQTTADIRNGAVEVAEQLAKASLTMYRTEHMARVHRLKRSREASASAEERRRLLLEAIDDLPATPQVILPLCQALIAADRVEAAIAMAREAVRREPARAGLQHALALALSAGGLVDEADQAFERLMSVASGNARVSRDYARHLAQTGRTPPPSLSQTAPTTPQAPAMSARKGNVV